MDVLDTHSSFPDHTIFTSQLQQNTSKNYTSLTYHLSTSVVIPSNKTGTGGNKLQLTVTAVATDDAVNGTVIRGKVSAFADGVLSGTAGYSLTVVEPLLDVNQSVQVSRSW